MDGAVAGIVEAVEGVAAAVAVIVVAAGWMSWWWHHLGWNSWRGAQDLM